MFDERGIALWIGACSLVLGFAGALRMIRERLVAFTRTSDLGDKYERIVVSLHSQVSPGNYEGTLEEENMLEIKSNFEEIQEHYAVASAPLQRLLRPYTCEHRLKDCVDELSELQAKVSQLIRPLPPPLLASHALSMSPQTVHFPETSSSRRKETQARRASPKSQKPRPQNHSKGTKAA